MNVFLIIYFSIGILVSCAFFAKACDQDMTLNVRWRGKRLYGFKAVVAIIFLVVFWCFLFWPVLFMKAWLFD